jgi:hypothetical protein
MNKSEGSGSFFSRVEKQVDGATAGSVRGPSV